MKIFMVIGTLNFGGAERVMANLANYFSRKHEVKICTLFEREIVYELAKNINVVQGVAEKGIFSTLINIRKEVQIFQPDIVVSFLTHVNIISILSILGLKIPIVVSERNDPNFEPAQLYRKILRKIIFPLANGFIFQTQEAKQYFSKRIQQKAEVIPNPVFVDDIPKNYNSKIKTKEFVAVGRLTEQKNYPIMLKAFKEVYKKYPEYKLIIYGKGEEEEKLKKMCIQEKIESNVYFMGVVKNIHEKIVNSHTYIMASNNEGMPNALMEAMALGICCISTDCPCGGPRELIKNEKNGILVPVNNVELLAKNMIRTIEEENLTKIIRNNAKKIREIYSLEEIGKKWEIFLKRVVNNFEL